jgi:aspartate-semialdehyde dehydrogenase
MKKSNDTVIIDNMTIAIVGATGAVGQEIMRVLEKRQFPVQKLRCFASESSIGKTLIFRGQEVRIEPIDFEGVDLAFFCAGKKISEKYIPEAKCLVVDSSSAFRMDVPLIIPEINPHAIQGTVIASPNCTATMMLMALAPLHRHVPIKRIVMSTYQAASGAGFRAMQELEEETRARLENRSFKPTIMPHPYAFNLFAHNAPMTQSNYNEEEVKVIEESRKILEAPELKIAVTCVRVPVLRAHSETLNVEFSAPLSAETARNILEKAPGVQILEDWKHNRFPMPHDASGKDDVFVGRIRQDLSQPNTLDLWVVGDQLLKGAALNAVQIAEVIFKRSCVTGCVKDSSLA